MDLNKKIVFTVNKQTSDRLQYLKEELNIDKTTDLINEALSLYDIFFKYIEQDPTNEIAIIVGTDHYTTITTNSFENWKKKHAN